MKDMGHLGRLPPRFAALMFGMTAAPIFWLGQMMLAYGVTAFACYPGDHLVPIASGAALRDALMIFDVIAILAALAGGAVSILCWRAVAAAQSRARFMATWGILSSLCFLAAILFEAIASLMVPLCTG